MPKFIIHKDGVYNLFTTVSDGPCFVSGLSLEQLHEYVQQESGNEGLRHLPERLERAHETGCSGFGWTLQDCIQSNRAGPHEREMPGEEFIQRYLTIAQPAGDPT